MASIKQQFVDVEPLTLDADFSLWTPRRVMAHHAKTFFWASRLLPRRVQPGIEVLYAFCRFVDDVADETGSIPATHAALSRIRDDLSRGESRLPPVSAFLDLARKHDVDIRIAQELVAGAASDIDAVRMTDERDLLRYCYRVASTVGLMVCGVLDVRDKQALAYAIDLGLAMQMTNIARDVVEDLARDRVYLPATWAPAETVAQAIHTRDDAARPTVLAAVHRLLDLSHNYYRSADHGMCYLPYGARWAIMTSSRAYEAIGKVIRGRGSRYFEDRAYTRKRLKLWYTLKAITLIGTQPVFRDTVMAPRHRAELHWALDGLPHADATAELATVNR